MSSRRCCSGEPRTDRLRVYHLDRGYENLEGKFRNAGVAIERATYDEFASESAVEA